MDPQPQPIRRFIKTILDFNIQIKKLRLPFKFVRLHGNELGNSVKLLTPDTRVWEMKAIREVIGEEEHIWLDNRFHEFSQLYSLKHGHQVHFKYKGTSNISVRIFNMSNCQITYPPLVNTSTAPPKPKPKLKQKKPRTPYKIKHDLCEYRSENSFQSPRHFKSSRPSFEVKLKAYNFRLNVVYVKPEFSRKHMVGTQAKKVKLKTIDGREWEVALKQKKNGRFHFGKGWRAFFEENKLKDGDVCIFELLKKSAIVFKVYIFIAI